MYEISGKVFHYWCKYKEWQSTSVSIAEDLAFVQSCLDQDVLLDSQKGGIAYTKYPKEVCHYYQPSIIPKFITRDLLLVLKAITGSHSNYLDSLYGRSFL